MQTLFEESNGEQSIEFTTRYDLIKEKLNSLNPIQYAKTRNFINGAVSYLSPYLSRGVISSKLVLETVLNKGFRPADIEKFLQELAWREYYQRIWQVKADQIWHDLKQPQPDVHHHKMVVALRSASTGILAIDQQIKRLYETGYMHNHARMYVAAIACNIARAHWREPARWLYYHLLDGDIASNNCSWQWVAAAFASRKYYCNQENINKYTHSSQRDTFLDRSYAEMAAMPVPDILKPTCEMLMETSLPQTALPIVDPTKPTLIYNSYNVDPAWRKNETLNRILLLEPSHFRKYPVSEKVISFIISLSENIRDIQIYCGEMSDLKKLYNGSNLGEGEAFISKEHPAFLHYPGIKDGRDWMFAGVSGYYPSFFSFWKNCGKYLK